MKLVQYVMTFDGTSKTETVQTWSDRETRPFNMDTWHAEQDGQWMPEVQGPPAPPTPETK